MKWLGLVLLLCASASRARAETTAFFYGADVPQDLLIAYDQVVVEPSRVAGVADVAALGDHHAALVAYFSLGELGGVDVARAEAAWRLGSNAAWSSAVMDLMAPGYRNFVVERFDALWRAGYRRFFLDTLDSYELVAKSDGERARQLAGLCSLIQQLAARHPGARLLLNRGFAALPEVAPLVAAVVAESLFDRWDAAQHAYVRVPDVDRAWLTQRLHDVVTRYGIPVIVIDYRPGTERAEARETARKIAALGFSPWVCDAQLDDVGVGALEILPRRVLMVSDAVSPDVEYGPARSLTTVLEYLGYVAEYVHPDAAFSDAPLAGRYAGVISVLGRAEGGALYEQWLLSQVRAGVPVVLFGHLGFAADGGTARALGLSSVPFSIPGGEPAHATRFRTRDASIGFEADPPLSPFEGVPVQLHEHAVARHLELALPDGATATAIATTSWGGLALSHVFAPRGSHGERAWVLDPFAFLTRALRLPAMPVPDVTTESGRRVALFAIDADGAGEHARVRGRPLVSQLLLQRLAAQPWPHALGLAHASGPNAGEALQTLRAAPQVYEADVRPGQTALRGLRRSLTWLEPLYQPSAPRPIALPIASDVSYLDGSAEAYPLQRVLATFALTDSPRRLRPLSFHYHAFAAASPGGLAALDAVYGELARSAPFVVRLDDYAARVRAFREQVIARDVRGAFRVFGGEALRTVRVPSALGGVNLLRSTSVAALAEVPQGSYVTFSARGARRLEFPRAASTWPHLVRCNGRVERFDVTPDRGSVRIELAAFGTGPLELAFADLPPSAACNWRWVDGTLALRSDPGGGLNITLPSAGTGQASLTCARAGAVP